MKIKTKIILSLLAGLLAVQCQAAPLWWGTLFPTVTKELATLPKQQIVSIFKKGSWIVDGIEYRFKSIEIFSFLRSCGFSLN